jgi:hypothetical protein
MREIDLPPNAPALLGSLRAIGYSFDSALADIVDNSIAAAATRVDLEFRSTGGQYVAIIDDGTGMTAQHLQEAMQHGGIGPDAVRSPEDLGRFGLGLKTASLSQCRRLTVVSNQNGSIAGACWSLDRVEATGRWTLGLLDPSELNVVPHVDRISATGHGTVVVWEDFDRALAGEADPDRALEVLMDKGREHLGLVFHRFLKAELGRPSIAISLNGLDVGGRDPFLIGRSTELPSQTLHVEGHDIVFTPYILPHRSRLSKRQLAEIDGEDGLRRTQGFYVYRNRRLITSGTWFRLMREQELTKLARVRVDIPNALDHLWQLDVKKATAIPPHQVRAGLLQVIEVIGGTSRRVYTHRGWKTKSAVTRVWDRVETAQGVNYRVNRDHPGLAAMLANGDGARRRALSDLLGTIEMSLPFDAIYADMAAEREVAPDFTEEQVEDQLRGILIAMTDALRDHPDALRTGISQIPAMEPFAGHPELTKRLLREIH